MISSFTFGICDSSSRCRAGNRPSSTVEVDGLRSTKARLDSDDVIESNMYTLLMKGPLLIAAVTSRERDDIYTFAEMLRSFGGNSFKALASGVVVAAFSAQPHGLPRTAFP